MRGYDTQPRSETADKARSVFLAGLLLVSASCAPRHDQGVDVRGVATCLDGQKIAGAYIKGFDELGNRVEGEFMSVQLHAGDPASANVSAHLSDKAVQYVISVGCGPLPGRNWAHDDGSKPIPVTNLNPALVCADGDGSQVNAHGTITGGQCE